MLPDILNINEDIQTTSDELQQRIQELDKKLAPVPKSIQGLHDKLDSTLDKSAYLEDSSEAKEDVDFDNIIKWDHKKGKAFLLNLPFYSMINLHFIVNLYLTDKELSKNKFKEEFGENLYQSFLSFLTTIEAINICKFYSNNEIIKITNCDNNFSENINTWVESILTLMEEKGYNDQLEYMQEKLISLKKVME